MNVRHVRLLLDEYEEASIKLRNLITDREKKKEEIDPNLNTVEQENIMKEYKQKDKEVAKQLGFMDGLHVGINIAINVGKNL